MNRKQLAEWLDVSPVTIAKWRDAGMIPPPRGQAGYDLRRTVLALLEHHRRKSLPGGQPTPPPAPTSIPAEIEREKLTKLRLENQRLREQVRELAPMEVLESYAAQLGSTIHEGLQALPGNIRKRVPHLRAAEMTLIRDEVAKIAHSIVDFNPAHPADRGKG